MEPCRSRHSALVVAVALLACCARDVAAQTPWWKLPLSSRARLDLRITADEATAPWSWDAQSRSPLDGSRFMVDLTAGDGRTGVWYAKGAANWVDADQASGHVAFALEQGDYLYQWQHADARAFGDERRFFTGDLGTPLMDDDVVDDYQHRVGVRADGGSERVGGTLLVSSLDAGADEHLVGYAKARAVWRPLVASLSYQVEEGDGSRDRAIAKGELTAMWKRASVVASIEQSGYGSGVFVPSWEWDAGRQFTEFRLARTALGDDWLLSGVYRYRRDGEAYANDLVLVRPHSELNRVGLYLSHSRLALDGRVVALSERRFASDETRGVAASARAFWRDNSETNLRAALTETDGDSIDGRGIGIVHASYRRSLQRFMGGVDALVDGIGVDAVTRVGAEVRVNWNATSALYLRWIASDAVERSDALYARLEFTPTARTWVTIAYGRAYVGDGPFFLEDDDALPTIDSEDVVTITVRGDF